MQKLILPKPEDFLGGKVILSTDNGYTLVPYSLNRVYVFNQALGHSQLYYPYYLGNAVINSIERSKEHIERRIEECKQGTRLPWFIVSGDDQVAGMISLGGISQFHYYAEIARMAVSPNIQKKGLATSAMDSVIKWAFEEAGFNRLEANVSTKNLASRRCFVKMGFDLEGIRRQRMLCADGWHDMAMYARTKSK